MKVQRILALILVVFMCTASNADDIYDSEPSYSAPYYAGRVKNSVLNEALDELNYIRSLAGVSDNITLDSEYTDKAQHGAILLDVIDTLTHTPSKPADMSQSFYEPAYEGTSKGNISNSWMSINGNKYGNITLSKSLKMYMDDSDSDNNLARAGHRRSLTNPRLKRVGFGLSTRYGYSVTYAHEEFGKSGELSQEEYEQYLEWLRWPIDDEFITWPANKKSHPLTYFDSKTAWSVTLDVNVFDKCVENAINVTLTRQSDNKSWVFNNSHRDGYFNIDGSFYDECIIFRPDNIAGYNNGEVWNVNISGLTRKDGTSDSISYSVRFTGSKTGYEEEYEYEENEPENENNNEEEQEEQDNHKTESNNNHSGGSGGGGCNSCFGLITLAFINTGIRRMKK